MPHTTETTPSPPPHCVPQSSPFLLPFPFQTPHIFPHTHMGRKMGMGLPSLLKSRDPAKPSSSSSSTSSSSSVVSTSWAWPSCKHPRTQSFRAGEDMYKTVNSVYLDTSDSCFTNSSSSAAERSESFSTEASEPETVIRGLRSDRLFFEPGGKTSSILEDSKCQQQQHPKQEEDGQKQQKQQPQPQASSSPFKESVAEEMESDNPYLDFRVSMEEMVAAHGLRDWDCLEELLEWYLRVNGKKTHGYILAAFVDLLLDIGPFLPSSSCSSCSCSSSFSIKFVVKEEEEESADVVDRECNALCSLI